MKTARMRRRVAAVSLMAAGAMVLAACSSPRKSEPIAPPLKLTDAQLQGRLLYDRYCYKCHTEGEGGLGPSLNEKPLPGFAMKFQIRHGLGTMPAFPPQRLSDESVDQIVEYLAALRANKS
ncbi:MAG: c-type cytochrome [Burkholderiales bacterium]|jgi:mono/diheme cytochrome c family protein